MNIQSSFTVYTAALHALILNSLLLAYFWLGLSWIDSIDSISANKRFSSSKTSSRKPYSISKQQEKQKHSAETTINFSSVSPSPLVHLHPHGGLLIGGPGTGAPPPSKSSPYAIIYNPRAETKRTSEVYDAAPLNDRLGELIRAVIMFLINNGRFTKLEPLQGFHFLSSIH